MKWLAVPSIAALIWCICAPIAWGEVSVKEVDGKLPASGFSKLGSGSGILIGPRLVLTNRHVVQDDKGKSYDGFRVLLGPDYKANTKEARLRFVCNEYDLAIIELSGPVVSKRTRILSELPPLAAKVVAYGFPLGSQFGVGITATGGQISRHPVETDTSDKSETADIKRALWHDAVITSGSSGGPLFSESGVLVGINYATLVRDGKHALAVSSSVVADFLAKSKAADGVDLVKSLDAAGEMSSQNAVYIEILSAGTEKVAAGTDSASSRDAVRDQVLAMMKAALPRMSAQQLRAFQGGDVKAAFDPVAASTIKEGQIARISAKMTIIQVLSNGMLVELDGVRCLIALLKGDGSELGAKIGDEVVFNVPHDSVYYVGKAKPYRTVSGKTSYYIPLFRANELVYLEDIRPIIAEHIAARQQEEARQKADQDAKTIERYSALLKHTFTDVSGRFTVEAVLVGITAEKIQLVRLSDGKKIDVQTASLSPEDLRWIDEHRTWARLYGERLSKHLAK